MFGFGHNTTYFIGSCISICTDDAETMNKTITTANDVSCRGIGCCNIDLGFGDDLTSFTLQLGRRNDTQAPFDEALPNVKVLLSEYYDNFVLTDLYSSWVNTSNVGDTYFGIAVTDQIVHLPK